MRAVNNRPYGVDRRNPRRGRPVGGPLVGSGSDFNVFAFFFPLYERKIMLYNIRYIKNGEVCIWAA